MLFEVRVRAQKLAYIHVGPPGRFVHGLGGIALYVHAYIWSWVRMYVCTHSSRNQAVSVKGRCTRGGGKLPSHTADKVQ